MIGIVVRLSLRRLWHNKPELVLTFLVPLIFFSIFACIFGSKGSRVEDRQLKVVICDEVRNTWSRQATEQLRSAERLTVLTVKRANPQDTLPVGTVTRTEAIHLVRRGHVSAAILLGHKSSDASQSDSIAVGVLSDSFDQLSSRVVVPLVQQSLAKIAPAGMTSGVQTASFTSGGQTVPPVGNLLSLPPVELVDVMGAGKSNPVIAMYAAGIAVMFLLFSATTASGSLLEEKENSTLERILCSRITMDHLLLGKWCYLTIIGCLQMTLMFLWGMFVFGLNLQDHLDGFAIMTFVTSGAAAGFALMLAALCKSRTQLGWVSTIVILTMSALGGSMVPRYLMGSSIQKVGQWTFNAWALDGYNKIFWRELPLIEIRNELLVLTACGLAFLVAARLAAVRWERS